MSSNGTGDLGHLLTQELVAAGERALDVQPKLSAQVRLLAAGDTNKNDPNVAIAALRSGACSQVKPDDYAMVLKVWAKRHRDLGRTRTHVAYRLHAVLCELVPGGISKGDHRISRRPCPGAGHAPRCRPGRPVLGGDRPGLFEDHPRRARNLTQRR